MGCCSSGVAGSQEKLDRIEKHLEDAPSLDLDVLSWDAKELRTLMVAHAKGGGGDTAAITRIQSLSDGVLTALEARVTAELVTGLDGEKHVEKLVGAAKELDSVRATKASVHVQQRIEDVQEKAALDKIPAIDEQIKGLSGPEHLVSCSEATMDIVESAHRLAPNNKKVVDQLLQKCVALAGLVLKLLVEAMKADVQAAASTEAVAMRLDKVATMLVGVMGAKWNPLIVDEVRKLVRAQALEMCKAQLGTIEGDVADSKWEAVAESLTTLQPWWPHAEKDQRCGDQVTEAFGKVDGRLARVFDEAVSAGDVGRTARLMQVSKDLDKAFSAFKVGGTAIGGLHAKLVEVSEAQDAAKHLEAIEAQIEKGSELDTAIVSKAIEALEPLWKAAQKNETVLGRLTAACRALAVCTETAAREAETSGEMEKLDALLAWAGDADKLRLKLAPPKPQDNEGLRIRVAPYASMRSLGAVEVELEKEEGLDPRLIFTELQKFGSLSQRPRIDEVKQRLAKIYELVEQRVLSALVKAQLAEPPDATKVEALRSFAERYDKLQSQLEGTEGKRLQSKLTAFDKANGSLSSVDEELAKDEGLNPGKLLKSLEGLKPLFEVLGQAASSLSERLGATISRIEERIATACRKAEREGETKKIDMQLQFAAKVDEVRQALLADDSKRLRVRLQEVVAGTKLEVATEEMAKEESRNTGLVLKKVQELVALWPDVGSLEDLCKQLGELGEKVRESIRKSADDAMSAGDKDKVKNLVKFVKLWEEACAKLGGIVPGGLQEELEDKLDDARQ